MPAGFASAAQTTTAPVAATQVAAEAPPLADSAASPSTRSGKKKSAAEKKLNPIVLIGGGVALAAVVGVAALFLMPGSKPSGSKSNNSKATASKSSSRKKNSEPGTEPAAAGPRQPFLSKRELTVGPGAKFATLSAALDDLRSEFKRYESDFDRTKRSVTRTIKVSGGQTLNERIVLDNRIPPGVRITVEEGQTATLAPSGSDPVIDLKGTVDRAQISGFVIDAQGKGTAIRMSGYLGGLVLKDLQIRGYSKSGVQCDGAFGGSTVRERIVVDNCRFETGSADAIGIRLLKGEDDPGYLRVQQCRFIGPQAAGISIDTNLVYLQVVHGLFSRMKTGIEVLGDNRRIRDLIVTHSTFYQGEKGIAFADQPDPQSNGLGFYNNLFSGQTGPNFSIAKDFKENDFLMLYTKAGGGAFSNLTDADRPEPAPPGLLRLFDAQGHWGIKDVKFQSTDPANPAFLKPAADSPAITLGRSPEVPEFKEPQIGALKP